MSSILLLQSIGAPTGGGGGGVTLEDGTTWMANRPGGLSFVASWDFVLANLPSGWSVIGGSSLHTDGAAPFPNYGQQTYPIGVDEHGAGGWSGSLPSLVEVYFARAIWQSSPSQIHPVGNKHFRVFDDQARNVLIGMRGEPTNNAHTETFTRVHDNDMPDTAHDPNLEPNGPASPYVLGRWNQEELYFAQSSGNGASDGICRIWQSGELAHDRDDHLWQAGGETGGTWEDFVLDGHRGGIGFEVTTAETYLRHGHIEVWGAT